MELHGVKRSDETSVAGSICPSDSPAGTTAQKMGKGEFLKSKFPCPAILVSLSVHVMQLQDCAAFNTGSTTTAHGESKHNQQKWGNRKRGQLLHASDSGACSCVDHVVI
jgi:hypothetical protein